MPLDESDPSLKDDSETSLFYTFTTPNSVEGTNQILIQNEDGMYLQGLEDGSTGWTLQSLPVIFPTNNQSILVGNEESETTKESQIYATSESNLLLDNLISDKSYLNINGLIIPIDSAKKKSEDITELADIVTLYKCKKCQYSTEEKEEFLTHYSETHQVIVVRPDYVVEVPEGTFELNGDGLYVEQVEQEEPEQEEEQQVEEKYILVCSQCSKGFDSIESLKHHMINDHKLKENKAIGNNNLHETKNENVEVVKDEGKTFLDKKILKSRKVNKSLPFKCEIRGCTYRFGTETVREEHMKCHIVPENQTNGTAHIAYQCSQCNIPQKSWRTTALHLWRQHNIQTDLIACPICFIFKATVAQLEQHMMIHSDKKSYICPQCGKLFRQAHQLRNHWKIHIDKGSDKRPLWCREIECQQCHKMFSNSKSLKKHLQSVHSKLKPFICNVCGHSCARKAMLQMHLRQHTGEKPYACEVCNYRTGDHNSLRRHNMIHTGDKPYKCPHCTYTSIQSSAYKCHIAIKHPGQTGVYSCLLCKLQTVNENTYLNHMSDHEKGIISTVVREDKTANNEANSAAIPNKKSNGSMEEGETITQPRSKIASSSDSEESCYLRYELSDEPSIDTGGITIPAEPECSSLLQMALLTS